MAFEKKTGLPYEILIRFNFGGAHQRKDAKLGDYEGAHYIDAEAIIDADTGAIVSYKVNTAVELPREQIASLLGDRFVAFDEQFRALSTKAAQLENDLAACIEERDAARATVNDVNATLSQHREKAAAAIAALAS